MKKVSHRIAQSIARLTYLVAAKGAGLASEWGWYQPKVPAKLCK